jgi:hypothetical protein
MRLCVCVCVCVCVFVCVCVCVMSFFLFKHASCMSSPPRLRSEKWMNVQVGDVIKLENNQFVTVSTDLSVCLYVRAFMYLSL